MEQYQVTGMSCAACSARVEQAVNAVEGVTACSVNLLTNSMNVEGTASPDAVIQAVQHAGYGALPAHAEAGKSDAGALEDTETPKLKRRLTASVCLLLPLMYVSMGHMMWGFPLPSFFENNFIAVGLTELLITALIMIINQKFFVNGFRGVLHKSPNMDTLVAMGSGISFLWSVYILFQMTTADIHQQHELSMQFYFESAAMILTLITVGKMLESHAKGRTTDALKSLMQLSPKTAVVLRDGKEVTVPAEQIKTGDIFLVRPGESIPADGVILEGQSAIDESVLTGESIPVDKTENDTVSAATINQSGFLKCEVTRTGEDTALSQIIRMVSEASATKAPIARIADKVSGVFVPVVIGIAIITLMVWLVAGQTIGYALARAISVLVISCPCALGLATPVAIMVGNGVGAKQGILFKTAVSLEETGKMQIAVLDKTGTITEGRPQVTDILPVAVSEEELLQLAVSLEQKSEHPLARAILTYAEDRHIAVLPVTGFQALSGSGLTAEWDGHRLYAGNLHLVQSRADITEEMIQKADRLAEEGKTPLFFVKDGELSGIIAVADVIRPDSAEAISQLQHMGMRVVMLTGDNKKTAHAIGKQIHADAVISDVLPDGKQSVIRKLQQKGKVMMIGDGINDAPALTSADIGIAVGAGTDIAIDAADVVLMKSTLSDAAGAVRLSRAVMKNIHENLFWAFIYNIIGIPLAAGVFIPLFGWELNPMFGAAAMSLSSFCVVTNALRLNFFSARNQHHDKPVRTMLTDLDFDQIKPETENKYILHIDGMMCPHCEMTVRTCLEAFPEVISAQPDHEQNLVILTCSRELQSLEEIRQAIADKGYVLKDSERYT